MSDDAQFSLTWPQARALALAGTQVRRIGWQQWLTKQNHLWFITLADSAHVARDTDFANAEFLARDWTTADWSGMDVCLLNPPGIPPFTPPAVSATATLASGNLVITALLGAATYGAYRLTFFVNGGAVYAVGATQSGSVVATVPDPGTITSISVLVQSVLPLPAWQVAVIVPVPAGLPVNFYTCGLSEWYGDSELTVPGTYVFDGSSLPGTWTPLGGMTLGISGGYFYPVIGIGFYRMGVIARDFTMTFKANFSDTSGISPYYNDIHILYASKAGDYPASAYLVALAPSNVDAIDNDPSNAIVYTCSADTSPFTWAALGSGSQVAPPDQALNTDYDCVFSRSGSTLRMTIGDQTFAAAIPAGLGAGELRLGFWYDNTEPSGSGESAGQIPMVKDIVVTIP